MAGIALVACPSVPVAQLAVDRERPTVVITFEEAVGWATPDQPGDNAVKHAKTGPQNRVMAERDSYRWKGSDDRALSPDTFIFRASNHDPDGEAGPKGRGDWTAFEDANGDGDFKDEFSVITGFGWAHGGMREAQGGLGGNPEAWASRIGGNSATDGNFADSEMVMRVCNRTGAAAQLGHSA